MILSQCTRDAALRVHCERIIKIYKVLFFFVNRNDALCYRAASV